jgi:hypothetical protein
MTLADQHRQPHETNKATAGSTTTSDKEKKDTTSVDIQNSTYKMLAAKAEERNLSTRKFINDLLYNLVKKADFIRKYCPDIYLDTVGNNSLYLKDYRPVLDDSSIGLPKTAEILIKDGRIFCSLDGSNDCVHIHFAYCLPEIAVLLKEHEQQRTIIIDEQQQQEEQQREEQKESSELVNNKKKSVMPHIAPSSLISVALGGAAVTSMMYLATIAASTNLIHHVSVIITHLAS